MMRCFLRHVSVLWQEIACSSKKKRLKGIWGWRSKKGGRKCDACLARPGKKARSFDESGGT